MVEQRRVRVGVIGAGLIAQVMHLHYLRELADRFETVALCDIAPASAAAVAARFGIPHTYSDATEMFEAGLDAVVIATSGDHAPTAVEAAQRGVHVLVEKPMCYSTAEGARMVEAAARSGVTMMVGYQKRYDPAYVRFREQLATVQDARLLRVTTLESPYWPYVEHYRTIAPQPASADVVAGLRAQADSAIERALGEATELERAIYEQVLLASLVHELNAVRGLLGEPNVLEHARLRPGNVTLLFRFGDLPVTLDRVDLPGMARYRMEFALYGPNRRMTLSFPSPFLRSEPTLIEYEDGQPGSTQSRATTEIVSYESAFRNELVAFHEAITTGERPATPADDAIRDIYLCEAIVEAHRTGRPVERPSERRS